MSNTPEEGAATTDLEAELAERAARIRQLNTLVGVLHREADLQAKVIQELREDVALWQARYARAAAAKARK